MKSKYFKTSDGTEFYTETNAINHARTLDDKKVTPPTVDVEEIEVKDVEVVMGGKGIDEGTSEGTDEGTDEVEKTVVNLSRFNKAQLIAFAVENELTIDDTATNPVIVASIEAQLTEKNQA